MPVERAQRLGPRVVDVRIGAHERRGPRHDDGEFMRRRVLARVEAGAAVVTEIGEVVDVGVPEFEPPGHRRKDGAEALAIAAGVADLHDARELGLGGRRGRSRMRRAGREPGGLERKRIKRRHAACLSDAEAAACVPAMRPNTVPIVMPTPAV